MLMRLDLALITEAVGRMVAGEEVDSVGENIDHIELAHMITCRQ